MSDSDFRPMRRADRQTGLDDAKTILHSCETGFLGVIGDNGYPYVIPMDFYYDNSDCDDSGHSIYFHSALKGHKIDAIEAGSKACFSVVSEATVLPDVLSIAFSSVTVFGKAYVVTGSQEKKQALHHLFDKYILGKGKLTAKDGAEYIEEHFAQTAVIKMEIQHMTGKRRVG